MTKTFRCFNPPTLSVSFSLCVAMLLERVYVMPTVADAVLRQFLPKLADAILEAQLRDSDDEGDEEDGEEDDEKVDSDLVDLMKNDGVVRKVYYSGPNKINYTAPEIQRPQRYAASRFNFQALFCPKHR